MKTETVTSEEQSKRSRYGIILLLLVLGFIFAVPFFPVGIHLVLHNILLSGILVFAALSVDRERKKLFIIALSIVVVEWLAYVFEMPVLITISQIVLFLYFIIIVVSLITQIATTRRVTARIIVESISGYLLMGIVFSLIIGIVSRNADSAYSIGGAVSNPEGLTDFVYYGFVTFTTLGYGDVVPLVPVSKSMAVLASVTGQIYLTVIIAMLVGKFLSGRQLD